MRHRLPRLQVEEAEGELPDPHPHPGPVEARQPPGHLQPHRHRTQGLCRLQELLAVLRTHRWALQEDVQGEFGGLWYFQGSHSHLEK